MVAVGSPVNFVVSVFFRFYVFALLLCLLVNPVLKILLPNVAFNFCRLRDKFFSVSCTVIFGVLSLSDFTGIWPMVVGDSFVLDYEANGELNISIAGGLRISLLVPI